MSDKLPIHINRSLPEPLYKQLRRSLEQLVLIGAYRSGESLPSSRQLAHELGLSRNTVNQAYESLISDGILVSAPRSSLKVSEAVSPPDSLLRSPNDAPYNWDDRLEPTVHRNVIEPIKDWDSYPYPLLTGQCDKSMLPRIALAKAFKRALQPANLTSSFSDNFGDDDPFLVQQICRKILPGRGIEASEDEVLITLGTQQGMYLLFDTLLGRKSTVALEEPGYVEARVAVEMTGAKIGFLSVDENGAVPPQSFAGVNLIHITPGHHYPTNVTMSYPRRQEFLDRSFASGCIIVEDDYDSEFRYRGSPTPSLKAMGPSNHVVYLGTFSKFIAPGVRMGYVVGDRRLIQELKVRRRTMYRHPPGVMQQAIGHFIESGDYTTHMGRYRRVLRKRWKTMNNALEEFLPIDYEPISGGLSIWVKGPEKMDIRHLAARAQEKGVLLYRTDLHFSPERRHFNFLRLGFSSIEAERIREAIRILADLLR